MQELLRRLSIRQRLLGSMLLLAVAIVVLGLVARISFPMRRRLSSGAPRSRRAVTAHLALRPSLSSRRGS